MLLFSTVLNPVITLVLPRFTCATLFAPTVKVEIRVPDPLLTVPVTPGMP